MCLADLRDAAELGVDEDGPAVPAERHVVGVHVARDPGHVGREHGVVVAMGAARGHDVVEAENLKLGREQECAAVLARRHPHAAGEGPFEHRNPPRRLDPDEEDLAGLMGREGEARPRPREPLGEMPRTRESELLFLRVGHISPSFVAP